MDGRGDEGRKRGGARHRGAVRASAAAAVAGCWPRCWRSASSTCSPTPLYAVATTTASCRSSPSLGSLYAVVTVLLARFVLGERLATTQRLEFVFAIVGVGLIATGA